MALATRNSVKHVYQKCQKYYQLMVPWQELVQRAPGGHLANVLAAEKEVWKLLEDFAAAGCHQIFWREKAYILKNFAPNWFSVNRSWLTRKEKWGRMNDFLKSWFRGARSLIQTNLLSFFLSLSLSLKYRIIFHLGLCLLPILSPSHYYPLYLPLALTYITSPLEVHTTLRICCDLR